METARNQALCRGLALGSYILEERIGAGGFAEVWRARSPLTDPPVVAIKIPHDPVWTENLALEAEAAEAIGHPGVVRTLEVRSTDDPPHLVLEYVPGQSLREMLHERGQLEVGEALGLLTDITGVMAAAHQRGVIHGDLKPENILVTETGEVKIGDFGARPAAGRSARLSIDLQTATAQPGTIAYMAPEQREGHPADARADVYALGLLLFEMLTGALPQGHELLADRVPNLLPAIDELFRRCYARRTKRYEDASSLLAAVQRARRATESGRPAARPTGPMKGPAPHAAASGRATSAFVLALLGLSAVLWPLSAIALRQSRAELRSIAGGTAPTAGRLPARVARALALVGLALYGGLSALALYLFLR